MKTPSVLAIIPARAGSKRIPGKNSKLFNGKPLVQWTIEAALASPLISQVVVSTDDVNILAMQSLFPTVIFSKRPPELAGDDVPGVDPVLYEMGRAAQCDYVMLLQPTSPLRTAEHISNALKFCFDANCSQLIGVRAHKPNDKFTFAAGKKLWGINGAIYISRWSSMLEHKAFITPQTMPFEMDAKISIDIDTPEDWELALNLSKEPS